MRTHAGAQDLRSYSILPPLLCLTMNFPLPSVGEGVSPDLSGEASAKREATAKGDQGEGAPFTHSSNKSRLSLF